MKWKGIKKDLAKAKELFKKAAEQGDENAKINLELYYKK